MRKQIKIYGERNTSTNYVSELVRLNLDADENVRRCTALHKRHSVSENPLEWHYFEDYLQSGDQWRWWGVYSFVVKRESFTRVRGFVIDLKNGEDCDLALRLGTETGFVQVTSSFTFAMPESMTLGAAAVIKPKYEGSNEHEAIPIPTSVCV
jgi:hypothetical protein